MQISFNGIVEVQSISIREKEDGTQYAVIKVSFTARGRLSFANLLCFTENIYSKIKKLVWYEVKGNVAFQSGNTFLVITKCEEAFSLPY